MVEDNKILQVENLKKYFEIEKGFFKKNSSYLHAVDGVSFYIKKGETFGLVGESGCGKSTTGRSIIKLLNPTEGKIIFDGHDITHFSDKEMAPFRKRIQMIFQDPYASLNGRMTVTDIIGEGMEIHNIATGDEKQKKIYELLNIVGLKREHANRYPHEFSGGQRQRIGIARALSVDPELIICDEPISALDVSIQAQVVNMLEDLQNEKGLTYLFIAHDLSMVKHISDRIGVMYLGMLMEVAESLELYDNPQHPYTEALLSAIPIPDPKVTRAQKRIVLEGHVTSSIDPVPSCPFKTRCPISEEICFKEVPEMIEHSPEHFVACHVRNRTKA